MIIAMVEECFPAWFGKKIYYSEYLTLAGTAAEDKATVSNAQPHASPRALIISEGWLIG